MLRLPAQWQARMPLPPRGATLLSGRRKSALRVGSGVAPQIVQASRLSRPTSASASVQGTAPLNGASGSALVASSRAFHCSTSSLAPYLGDAHAEAAALTSSAWGEPDGGEEEMTGRVNEASSDAHAAAEEEEAVHDTDEGDDLPRLPFDRELLRTLVEAVPLSTSEETLQLLIGAKNAKEVRHILEHVVYPHHLCVDVLNGHGYRVAVLQALTTVASRTGAMEEWFECVSLFRRLGFVLTRTFAAEGFTTIRQWLTQQFNFVGRSPALVTEGIAHIRELVYWCHEDQLVFDHVLYTRIVFLLTMIVSFFDRQNMYRSVFPPDFTKRDGIVVEWVITHRRCVDFDECVLQCDALMEEVLELLRQDIPSRPIFSIMYRLMDYYFATDNVEKMIAVMEDAVEYGVRIAESSTAKLMQLACAFNYPNVPELFMRWRVSLPQCVLATPDMSRLMFYYGRSGGGRPCPVCGETYNHRNPSVYCWLRTPPHQRQCPALRMAREEKGELEECRELPQNADWSERGFQLWELSAARSIEWGTVEWRAFLLCCIFSPRAMEAKKLLDDHFDPSKMDNFLRAVYIRLLRHHAPELTGPTIQQWQERQYKMSPIVLQEGLMAAATVDDPAQRLAALQHVWRSLLEKDSYVMPMTKRYLARRRAELADRSSREEKELLEEIVRQMPRHLSLLDMKDSPADFAVGTSKRNVYIPPAVLERVTSRQSPRANR